MTLDVAARRAAVKLIGSYGKSVTLTRVTLGAYDKSTGHNASTSAATAMKAVVEDYKGFQLIENTIVAGDKKLTVAAQLITPMPTLSDSVTIDGLVYAIISVATVFSGELPALYEIQARKA